MPEPVGQLKRKRPGTPEKELSGYDLAPDQVNTEPYDHMQQSK